jgi:MFS transporter, ACS family, tartrate transporter
VVDETAVVRKVARRYVPLLIVCAFFVYLDRVNVSFAASTMNVDIGLSSAAYGFGAGIFFLTYVLFEVPSNIILERVGARRWLTRIMITWGVISLLEILARGPVTFYLLRGLLGAGEAGLYPGVVFLLSNWFPAGHRGRIGSLFWLSIPLSTVIGGPVSGPILELDGFLGLHGWMWLFIIESVPVLILAPVVHRVLTDKPADARWLAEGERAWLTRRMAAERAAAGSESPRGALRALMDLRVPALGLVCFGAVIMNYGVSFFLPQIVRNFGLSTAEVGLVTAIPYVAALAGIPAFGFLSDRWGNRRGLVVAGVLLSGVFLASSTFFRSPVLVMTALTVAGFFMFGYLAPFWAIPQRFLEGAALASGIAAINAIGNVGGFVGPYLMGSLLDATGSFEDGLRALAGIGALLLLCLLVVKSRRPVTTTSRDPAAPVVK